MALLRFVFSVTHGLDAKYTSHPEASIDEDMETKR